ncbi:hypothetical protein FOZ63_018398, partial [Perkinsus olseni]
WATGPSFLCEGLNDDGLAQNRLVSRVRQEVADCSELGLEQSTTIAYSVADTLRLSIGNKLRDLQEEVMSTGRAKVDLLEEMKGLRSQLDILRIEYQVEVDRGDRLAEQLAVQAKKEEERKSISSSLRLALLRSDTVVLCESVEAVAIEHLLDLCRLSLRIELGQVEFLVEQCKKLRDLVTHHAEQKRLTQERLNEWMKEDELKTGGEPCTPIQLGLAFDRGHLVSARGGRQYGYGLVLSTVWAVIERLRKDLVESKARVLELEARSREATEVDSAAAEVVRGAGSDICRDEDSDTSSCEWQPRVKLTVS